MARFTAVTESEAVVAAPRPAIWRVLTDPVLLPRLTPLLRRIDVLDGPGGTLWRWHMTGLSVLGAGITPVFTERMTFTECERIDYTHEPPAGAREMAAAEGVYHLADAPGGTKLTIRLELEVELPLPGLAAPAVTRVMKATMRRMGERFSANLQRQVGNLPDDQPATGERSRSGSR